MVLAQLSISSGVAFFLGLLAVVLVVVLVVMLVAVLGMPSISVGAGTGIVDGPVVAAGTGSGKAEERYGPEEAGP